TANVNAIMAPAATITPLDASKQPWRVRGVWPMPSTMYCRFGATLVLAITKLRISTKARGPDVTSITARLTACDKFYSIVTMHGSVKNEHHHPRCFSLLVRRCACVRHNVCRHDRRMS